jgi:hypothetical protein
MGTVPFKTKVLLHSDRGNSRTAEFQLERAVYCPKMPATGTESIVLPVKQFVNSGCQVVYCQDDEDPFHGPRVENVKKGFIIPLITREDGWFMGIKLSYFQDSVDLARKLNSGVINKVVKSDGVVSRMKQLQVAVKRRIYDEHVKFGHLGGEGLQKLLGEFGLIVAKKQVDEVCSGCRLCLMAKTQKPKRSKALSDRPTEPYRSMSIDFVFWDKNVIAVATDRHSKYTNSEFIKQKPDVLDFVLDLNARAVNVWGKGYSRVHSDSEYVLNKGEFARGLKAVGIRKTSSAPENQSRNGDVESEIKYLKRGIKLILEHIKDTPIRVSVAKRQLWELCQLQRNVCPRARFKWGSAWERHYQGQPELLRLETEIKKKLLPPGTEVVYHRDKGNATGCFVGLDTDVSGIGYRVYDADC